MVLTQPSRLLDRHLPLCHGPVPAPRRHIPSNGGRFTRHQRGFTQLTRPVVPSPVAARIERAALGLSPGFAPRRPGAGRRTPGRGQAIEHGPGTTRSTSHQSILPIGSSLTTCDLASHHESRQRRESRQQDDRSLTRPTDSRTVVLAMVWLAVRSKRSELGSRPGSRKR
jgi:hypothetical protein